MKKHLSFAVVLIAAALSLQLRAQSFSVGALDYYVNDDGASVTLSGHNGAPDAVLVIPDNVENEGTTYAVTRIGSWALSGQSSITELVVGGNVSHIDDYAFHNCYAMTSVTLPVSVVTIDVGAFVSCPALQQVSYLGTLEQWLGIDFGDYAANPLYNGHHLFIGGSELTNLVIPEGVSEVKQYAFNGLTALETVTIPASVDSVGESAFSDCNGLARVYCSSLADWCNIGFASEGANPLYYGHKLYVGNNRVQGALDIPEGVTAIKPYAFIGINGISAVRLPEGLQSIGRNAFWYSEWYCEYTIPSTVATIGEYAIYGYGPVYYNATNCNVVRQDTWVGAVAIPYVNSIVVGAGVQSIPRYLLPYDDQVSSIQMLGEPPAVANFALDNLRPRVDVQVPCGMLEQYEQASGWSELAGNGISIRQTPPYSFRLGSAEHGWTGVNSYATCTTPAQFYAGAEQYYHFVRWSDGITDNPRTIELTQDTLLTPVFAIDTYYVHGIAWPDDYGYVEGSDSVPALATVTLTAHANHGYHFTQWSDGLTDSSRTVNVTWDWSIAAWFERNQYSVSLAVDESTPHGTVGESVTAYYLDNIQITATPDYGYRFSHWSDGSTDNPRTISVAGDTSLTASFEAGQYAVNGVARIVYDAEVDTSLSMPTEDIVFDFGSAAGWTMMNNGNTNAWHIGTLNGNQALFVSNDGGASNDYADTLDANSFAYTTVHLTAGTHSYSFDWRCQGENNYDYLRVALVPTTEDFNYQWGYNGLPGSWIQLGNNQHVLQEGWVTTSGQFDVVEAGSYNLVFHWRNDGSVKGYPPAAVDNIHITAGSSALPVDVDSSCYVLGSDTVTYLENVELTAVAGEGYHFIKWSDDATENPHTVTADDNKIVYALFGYDHFSLSVAADSAIHSVHDSREGDDNYLSEHTLTPQPATGWHFTGWNDGSTDNPRTFVLTQDTAFTAFFERNSYSIAVTSDDTLMGTVSGDTTLLYLDTAVIMATPAYGYRFAGWDDRMDGWDQAVRSIAASGDMTFTAHFELLSLCDIVSDDSVSFCYTFNGTGMTLLSVNGTLSGTVVIPDSIAYGGMIYPVTEIDGWVFNGQTDMTWVTMPKGLTHVGSAAFNSCENLTRVYWNGSIEQWCDIDFDDWTSNPLNYARHLFMNGTEVVNLVIPEGVTFVKQYAFINLSSLASVTLPSTLDTIGYAAFNDCNGLQHTYFNGTVADWCRIGFYDGWGCNPINYSHDLYIGGSEVVNLIIPEGITAIKPYAFNGMYNLHSIQFPEGLHTIGKYAFGNGSWNVTFTIPSTVTRIEEWAIQSYNTLYFNATNCDFFANNAIPYASVVVVSEAVETLPLYLITGNINILKMQGPPPTVTGDVLDRLRDDAEVQVPCGLLEDYQNAPVWNNANLVEANTFALKFGAMEHGSAWVGEEPTCTTPAVAYANSDQYYHFTQWTDGNTDNPRTIEVTQDTVITPLFAIDTYYVYGVPQPSEEYGVVLGNDSVLALDSVTLTAHANYGYHFTQWGDGVVDSVRSIEATWDWWYDAWFERNQYTIALSVDEETPYGQVSGDTAHYYLDAVTVSATPDYGYHFTQWNDSVTDNPRTIVITQDTALTASFEINTYTVAAQPNVDDRGTAEVSDTAVVYLDSVFATATANYGYHFTQWSDGLADNPRHSVVTDDVVYVAQFDLNQYAVSLDVDDTIHGSVAGVGGYDYLTPVSISATPAYGYHFTQWSDSVADNPRTVILTQDTAFTALFAKNVYNVATLANDDVMGSATVSSATAEYLDSVTIAATANYGYHFTQWNDGSTETPRQVEVTADAVYTAAFDFNQYTVSLAVDDAVHGSVDGDGDYNYLTPVNISATPAYGYHFTQWSDGETINPRTVGLTQDTAFMALFANNVYTFTLSVNDTALGEVAGAGDYAYLDTVSLTATCTAAHHHFVRWSDGVTDNPRSVVVSSDSLFSAIFAIDTHMLVTVVRHGTAEGVADNDECGTIVGAGLYPYGSVVTLEATAAEGFHFAEWDDAERTLDRVVTVTQDTVIAAVFTDDVVPSIYMVSVQGARNVVIWTQDLEVASYNIYREGNTSGQYELVATIPFYEAPMWTDTASRPTTRSYRYKMTANDVYGYESDFSDVHKTMHLTISQGIGTNWNLVWTEYQGTDYSTYVIYRGTDANNIEQIDIMPSGGNTTYTDENAPEGVVYYQVGIILSASNTKANDVILSNVATNGTDVGIRTADASGIRAYAADRNIVVEGADGRTVRVFDVVGRLVSSHRTQVGDAATVIRVPETGVYMVKVDGLPARRVTVIR